LKKLVVLLAALALALTPDLALADPAKIAQDVDQTNSKPTIDVIVQFARPATSHEHAKVGRAGGLLKAELGLIRAAVYSMPAAALAGLADDPDVLYISPDREVRAALEFAVPATGADVAFQSGWNGTGTAVAIIDSGILEAKDLLNGNAKNSKSRVVYSESFVPKVSTTSDQYGHGTHVAGIVGGNGNASSGSAYFKTFRGIAPAANLVNLRVLDSKGVGSDSAVINAIQRAIQLKDQHNIRVINLSLGRPVFESYTKDPLCKAVEEAWKAGIVVVVAAGNEGRNTSLGTDGYATIFSPANHPLVITVGAMKDMGTPSRADDLMTSYSSKGPTLLDHVVKPDVVAPGNHILALLASKSLVASDSSTNKILYSYYQDTTSTSYSGDYYKLSGTSMAAPMVSGGAALMLQKEPALTPDSIKARLMKTATKTFPPYSTSLNPVTGALYNIQYDIFTVGAGYVDIWAALNSLDVVPSGSTAASPVAVFDAPTNTVLVVNTETAVFGKAAVWGTAAVWGAVAVWGTNVFIDGLAAVWGTSSVWGSVAVWGTSGSGNEAIWGTAAVWGTTNQTGGETMEQLIRGDN
jgi:serine protease AprX